MYNFKKHKILLNIYLLGIIVSALLILIVIWNSSIVSGKINNIGGVTILILLLLSFGVGLFFTAYRFSDKEQFDKYIKSIKDEEKLKNFKESEKSEKTVETEIREVDINSIAEKIIPDIKDFKNIEEYSDALLSNLSEQIEIVTGLCYHSDKKTFKLSGKFALTGEPGMTEFNTGDTLPGQAAKSKEVIIVDEIPDSYFQAESGTGKSKPKYLIMVPVLLKSTPVAVLELSTFRSLSETQLLLLEELKNNNLGERISKILKSAEKK